jgi:spore coat polysaccharide biosynthesis protein SpsF
MASERLPGKALKEVCGKPLLAHCLERLKRCKGANLIVATSDEEQDRPIIELCASMGVPFFAGNHLDVLDRYWQAVQVFEGDVICRITADCPLIDPKIVEEVIAFFQKSKGDYASNTLRRTFPRGMDVEVFTKKALKKCFERAKGLEREHVTLYMTKRPKSFKMKSFEGKKDNSELRLTVDTKEDLELVTKIFDALYPEKEDFDLGDILKLLKEHPEWKKINAHVEQKP